MTAGSSWKRDCSVTSASKAGSRSRSSASAIRSAGRAAGAASRGDGADLARADAEPAGVERPAQREADLRVAVPAEVDDGALGREQVERQLQPGGRRAGVHDQVAAVGGGGRKREVRAEGGRDAGPPGIDVHERDLDGRDPAQQACDAAADHSGADDGDPVADQRGGVPESVDGGLHGAREHGAGGWYILGHDGYRGGRYDVGGLVRVQAKDGAAKQLGRPLLNASDAQIAVLDRSREVPLLERRPHRRVLVGRHAAPEHQRLGAAADTRAHGAHHHVAAPRRGQRDRPDLPAAGRAQPERVCGSLMVDHRRDDAPHVLARIYHGLLFGRYAHTPHVDARRRGRFSLVRRGAPHRFLPDHVAVRLVPADREQRHLGVEVDVPVGAAEEVRDQPAAAA